MARLIYFSVHLFAVQVIISWLESFIAFCFFIALWCDAIQCQTIRSSSIWITKLPSFVQQWIVFLINICLYDICDIGVRKPTWHILVKVAEWPPVWESCSPSLPRVPCVNWSDCISSWSVLIFLLWMQNHRVTIFHVFDVKLFGTHFSWNCSFILGNIKYST